MSDRELSATLEEWQAAAEMWMAEAAKHAAARCDDRAALEAQVIKSLRYRKALETLRDYCTDPHCLAVVSKALEGDCQ